jgi:putative radical SAM enzyme (TIGR03279 family)
MAEEELFIEAVVPGSIAEELEIEAGDRLLMINGSVVRDIIDYNFLASDEELLFLLKKADGDLWELEFDRPDEGIGISFAPPAPASCGNNCVFCFVHQLPRGLRKPLYVKDEDYRLSFLYGNYVTLTNILPEELARIEEQRLSPLYISVHATDNAVRQRLLGRTELVPIMETIGALAAGGIVMHTQVVLCPGLNDGAVLERTVADLAALYPTVASLAIVPLGMTRHRQGLPNLTPVTAAYAGAFIDEWLPRQAALQERLQGDFLHLADEFFIKGGREFPEIDRYGDFPQLENGVGMIPLFLEESAAVLDSAARLSLPPVTVVSGVSPAQYIAAFIENLSGVTSASITLVPVRNYFFGEEVTVTGLVSGADIVAALDRIEEGSLLLIPDVMLKEGEGLFLDEMSIADISKALRCETHIFAASPEGFYQKLVELAELKLSFS